jgi:hypothetical protein
MAAGAVPAGTSRQRPSVVLRPSHVCNRTSKPLLLAIRVKVGLPTGATCSLFGTSTTTSSVRLMVCSRPFLSQVFVR